MSGGSMDYIYYKIEEIAVEERDYEIADLLSDLASYLHDEEWWLSGDYNEGHWEEARAKFKAKWLKGERCERLRGYVNKRVDELREELMGVIGE